MRYAALFALFALTAAKDLSPVDRIREHFYSLEKALWRNVTSSSWKGSELGEDVELSKAFVGLDRMIAAVPVSPRVAVRVWAWQLLSEKMAVVEGVYGNFAEFVRRQAAAGAVPAPTHDWLALADLVLHDPRSVAHAVRKMHDLLPHDDQAQNNNLFKSALKADHPDLCELQLSQHQLIYDMYNTVSLAEIKGYAMMQFSWMLLRIYDKGNFTQEVSLTRERYAERTARTALAARAALSVARRDLYRCDPVEHREGETYAQVTKLLQGYIENEIVLNADGTCRENCAYYSATEYNDQNCVMNDLFCHKQPKCTGRVFGCRYIDSDMTICPSSRQSKRRYEWVEYENGKTLGRPGSCMRGNTKVDSWWRWLFWHCSYCMCLCEAGPDSERYFSLREAATTGNKVVTGLRIVKLDRVFHLQISEGILGERGLVTPGPWVPVQKFDPRDRGVKERVDYHTLTYERRAIDLDELDSPTGYILTGVRFRMIGAHLHFEIRSTPFNYTTGRLTPEKSVWNSNDITEANQTSPRLPLELYQPDIPTRIRSPLPVDSKHNQYVEFTHSDFEADAAQSTVPFIDIQPLQPMKGAALISGAGIVHKGGRGSGGYIAAKLFTYDYFPHVNAEAAPTSYIENVDESVEYAPTIN